VGKDPPEKGKERLFGKKKKEEGRLRRARNLPVPKKKGCVEGDTTEGRGGKGEGPDFMITGDFTMGRESGRRML